MIAYGAWRVDLTVWSHIWGLKRGSDCMIEYGVWRVMMFSDSAIWARGMLLLYCIMLITISWNCMKSRLLPSPTAIEVTWYLREKVCHHWARYWNSNITSKTKRRIFLSTFTVHSHAVIRFETRELCHTNSWPSSPKTSHQKNFLQSSNGFHYQFFLHKWEWRQFCLGNSCFGHPFHNPRNALRNQRMSTGDWKERTQLV